MASPRAHLVKLHRRPVDNCYQEKLSRFIAYYEPWKGDGRTQWRVLVKVRDLVGDPWRNRYVNVEDVSGAEFPTLTAAREAMRNIRGKLITPMEPRSSDLASVVVTH